LLQTFKPEVKYVKTAYSFLKDTASFHKYVTKWHSICQFSLYDICEV